MKHKILIIDDEEIILTMLKKCLEAENFLVYIADNAKKALEFMSVAPDIILLDINMPEMDGLELCQFVREHISCPIIFLTARVTEQDVIKGLSVGGDLYFLFIAVLVFSWWGKFRGVTKTEIDWANGKQPADISFDRPLLAQPTEEDEYFGMKTSEDYPEEIMTGVTRNLLREYKDNVYATYPLGNYKAVVLDSKEQANVLEILCEITGLTEEQLNNLPQGYFPDVTGAIISFNSAEVDEDGTLHMSSGEDNKANGSSKETDKTKKFISQVTYERFKELMREMETIIGEEGSQYGAEMMITYFGMSEMSYEESCAEYDQTIQSDKVTGSFARLFCDYMGLSLGLYPIFIIVYMWLRDRLNNMSELLYIRRASSFKLVVTRYLSDITMVLIPVILLSFESLLPLMSFGSEHGISIDLFAYIKYILWWLLPTVIIVSVTGTFFTLLTDSPIAVLLQFLWWIIDKGVTGLSGDTKITTLMIRHNTLRGYELIQDNFYCICMNRLLMGGIGILLVIMSVWILQQKRRGRINAANIYGKVLGHIKNKFLFIHTK